MWVILDKMTDFDSQMNFLKPSRREVIDISMIEMKKGQSAVFFRKGQSDFVVPNTKGPNC